MRQIALWHIFFFFFLASIRLPTCKKLFYTTSITYNNSAIFSSWLHVTFVSFLDRNSFWKYFEFLLEKICFIDCHLIWQWLHLLSTYLTIPLTIASKLLDYWEPNTRAVHWYKINFPKNGQFIQINGHLLKQTFMVMSLSWTWRII